MARYLFNLPDVQPSQKVRVDTASGSDSPATGLTTVAGDAISSTLTGNHGGELPEIFGPDGVATLYLKTLTYSGAVTGSPVTVPGYNETPVLPGSAAYTPLRSGRAARALIEKLGIGRDVVAAIALGDSTVGTVSGTTDTTFFYYLAMAGLWAKFPAYTVSWLTWDHATQAYLLPTHPQTGTAGDRYLQVLDNSCYLTAPDSAGTSIVGDIDVRVKCELDNWTAPGVQSTLASKQDGAGARSWRFEIATTGKLVFSTAADGTTLIDATSTLAVPFANGATGWVRATRDVDNGASGNTTTFYTSTDGVNWTQLGTPVVIAGATTIADTTALNYFPGRTSGGYNDATTNHAKFFELQVLNGLGGTPAVVLDMDVLPQVGTSLTDYTGNVWTLNTPGSAHETRGGAPGFVVYNGGTSGQVIAYSNDPTRGPKQTPYPCDLAVIDYSENEGSTTAYRAAYKQLADFLIAKWPDCRIVATIQPARLNPASNIPEHDLRCGQIASLAASQDYGVIDVRAAFGTNAATLTQSDGIHPTVGGGAVVWANEFTASQFSQWTLQLGLGA